MCYHMHMNRKAIAVDFLTMVSSADKVREAFSKYIHPDFYHHNAYFKGDRETLLEEMEKNAKDFPGKTIQVLRALEDDDLVAVHCRVSGISDNDWSLIHIFRFEGDKIIESWEASQEDIKDSPNSNGVF